MKKKLSWILLALLLPTLVGCAPPREQLSAKPVLYLYPEVETEVTVRLDYDGKLTTTWPTYDGGWAVTAQPGGSLSDAAGNQYSYLFWEGVDSITYDLTAGFCVAGADTGDFLRDALGEMGLTPQEYNEFIVYWLPHMEGNPYNHISFQGSAYTDHARLDISPAPDSLLRVFMAWKPLDAPVELTPQSFPAFARQGFTVVEWGGVELS